MTTFIFIIVIITVAALAFLFGLAIGKKDYKTDYKNPEWLHVPPPGPFDEAR